MASRHPSPSDTILPLRATTLERVLTLLALLCSVFPGWLVAAWTPIPTVGALIGVVWGVGLGAIIVGVAAMRLQERLRAQITMLERRARQPMPTPLPSRAPMHTAPGLPRHFPTPLPEVGLEAMLGELPRQTGSFEIRSSDDVILSSSAAPSSQSATSELRIEDIVESAPTPTSQLPALTVTPLSDTPPAPPTPSEEITINEARRVTADFPAASGARLMSMAQLDAEMTTPQPLDKRDALLAAQRATRPFDTPAPLLHELMHTRSMPLDPSDDTDEEPNEDEHLQDTGVLSPDALHLHQVSSERDLQSLYASRATVPLDAEVIAKFSSDQRSTQRIEALPELMTRELSRQDAKPPREELDTVQLDVSALPFDK